jgi:hypothetical protein
MASSSRVDHRSISNGSFSGFPACGCRFISICYRKITLYLRFSRSYVLALRAAWIRYRYVHQHHHQQWLLHFHSHDWKIKPKIIYRVIIDIVWENSDNSHPYQMLEEVHLLVQRYARTLSFRLFEQYRLSSNPAGSFKDGVGERGLKNTKNQCQPLYIKICWNLYLNINIWTPRLYFSFKRRQ